MWGFFLNILFCSIDLSIIVSLQYFLVFGSANSLSLFRVFLGITACLFFCMNYRISLSKFLWKSIGIFIRLI